MFLTSPVFIAQSVFGFTALVLHGIIAILIGKNGIIFAGSFSTIFCTSFFVNLVAFLTQLISVGIPQNTCQTCAFSHWFESNGSDYMLPNSVLSEMHAISVTMQIIQFFITWVHAINNYISCLERHVIDSLWRRCLPFIIFSIIILPFILTSSLFMKRVHFAYSESYNHYYILQDDSNIIINLFTLILEIFLSVLTITAIVGAYFAMKWISRNPRRIISYVCTVLFIIQLLVLLDDIIIQLHYFIPYHFYEVATLIKPYLSGMLTLIHPWILIAVRQTIRNALSSPFTIIMKPKTQVTRVVEISHPPRRNQPIQQQQQRRRKRSTFSKI